MLILCWYSWLHKIVEDDFNNCLHSGLIAKVKDGKRKKWAEGLLSQNGRYEMKEVKSI